MNSATIVQKLWNYCNVLRDDGMSYGDYVEQLTYLLLLKTKGMTRPIMAVDLVVTAPCVITFNHLYSVFANQEYRIQCNSNRKTSS